MAKLKRLGTKAGRRIRSGANLLGRLAINNREAIWIVLGLIVFSQAKSCESFLWTLVLGIEDVKARTAFTALVPAIGQAATTWFATGRRMEAALMVIAILFFTSLNLEPVDLIAYAFVYRLALKAPKKYHTMVVVGALLMAMAIFNFGSYPSQWVHWTGHKLPTNCSAQDEATEAPTIKAPSRPKYGAR